MIESYFIGNRSTSIKKVTCSAISLVGSEQWDVRLKLLSGLREKGYHAMNWKRSSSRLTHWDSCLGQALRVMQNAKRQRNGSTAIFVFGSVLAVANDEGKFVFSSACAFAT